MNTFHQLRIMLWKQTLVDRRNDIITVISLIVLPSVFLLLSSTSDPSSSTSAVDELRECKVSHLLYCNYPIARIIPESLRNDSDLLSDLKVAASNVAEQLGSSYEEVFPNQTEFPSRIGGNMTLINETTADLTWYTDDENTVFPDLMITSLNWELEQLNTPLRFRQQENPFKWEGTAGFDWRVASFLQLMQTVAVNIITEKSTNMYNYLTRVGLRPGVYWIFQYLYYMTIASLSIALVVIFSSITGRDIDVGAYFVSAWFHVTFGIFLASFFRNKAYANLIVTIILLLAFLTPVIFVFAFPQTQEVQSIFRAVRMIPIFMTTGSVDSQMLVGGSIITICFMTLSFYLAPLFSVHDGMFSSTSRNYLYFLSPKFWTEGIVAVPSYDVDESYMIATPNDPNILQFFNCVKKFRYSSKNGKQFFKKELNEKIIGPMNLTLKRGKISTLLGPNGVGKSTFLKIAGGYFIPSGGEILFQKKNLFRTSLSLLKQISLCPQENYLFDEMTVEEHLQLISRLRDTSKVEDLSTHIDWILTTLDIVDKRTTLAANLSGGMKRRLSLAMAVLGFPDILLLDEPSSGVDATNQRGIWKLLETTKEHSAILLTSHSALEAVILSDYVINMSSSTDISSSSGYEGLGFSLKNTTDNSVKEYAITSTSVNALSQVISYIPNDGTEWKIASKRLESEKLLQLTEIENGKESDTETVENGENAWQKEGAQATEMSRNSNSPMKQVLTLLSMTYYYPDRVGFLLITGLPIQGLFIWYGYKFSTLSIAGLSTMIPLTPLAVFIASSILLSNAAVILAQERELGVSKLLFSQGISRKAYLASFVLYYTILSIVIPASVLIFIGSIFGTFGSVLAVFFLFISYCIFHLGLSLFLGSTLNPRTAFIAVCILPTIFGIFGQGATSQQFSNSYPGSVGQVMAALIVGDLTRFEWGLYALSVFLNILFGFVGFYFFLLKFENNNPIPSKLCGKNSPENTIHAFEEETGIDEESSFNTFVLEGQNIDKIYGTGMNDKTSFKALDDVTVCIPEGSLVGLVGKSGAGKSTLMEILSGQISSTKGSVFVGGKKVQPHEISTVVSLCSQLDTIWPDMKVIDAIKIFMKCRGYKSNSFSMKKIIDPHVSSIINQLDIQDMLKKAVKKLSGGQKRRLAFLASLIGETKVVLVDEAMTGVDIETRQIMWKILQNEVYKRNRSVVVTTHDLSEVEQYCNTVGILHHGKLVEMGLLSDIRRQWSGSIKLTCLVDSRESLQKLKDHLSSQNDMKLTPPHVTALNESSTSERKGKIVVTYPIDLQDLRYISSLIGIMENLSSASENQKVARYWSIEPMNLDDFVQSSSTSAK